jgi:peptidoglycan/LPS O-acetylase OafA/YrhL
MSETATAVAPPSPSPATSETGERFYFPELDGLRFIAFMMVYLFHRGVPEGVLTRLVGFRLFVVFRDNGGYGVQLFFILSGYLITALLLREEARYGRIALRAFWVRRILRIWPLYYLVVLIGFFLLPAIDGHWGTRGYSETLRIHLLPFVCFLGNWSMALVSPIAYDWLSVLWSVCVEEQFYIIVPLLLAFCPSRRRPPLVVLLIIGSIAVRWICAYRNESQLMIVFNTFAQFDTLLSGVLLALLLGWKGDRPILTKWLRWLQWPLYVVIGWVFSQPHLGQGTPFHRTWDFVWVWLCGLGVVIVAVWGQGWLRAALSYSRIAWLGKISYGLYMYHEVALWARAKLYDPFNWFPNDVELYAIGAFALTIGLAAASYYGYERRFLELKRRWTRIPSRPV